MKPEAVEIRVEVAGQHELGPGTETEPTTLEGSTQQSATSRGLLLSIMFWTTSFFSDIPMVFPS